MRLSRLAPLALACLAVTVAACSEKLESTVGCPELCPGQGIDLINLTLDPVILDSTVNVFSQVGTEPSMLLASRGDTLDSRVIIRFDTLPQKYRGSGSDIEITRVESAFLHLRLDVSEKQGVAGLTVNAYDVDSSADDTSAAALVPLFTAERLLGTQTFAPGDLKDSVRIPLSGAAVLAKVRAPARLRIGLRITDNTGQFHILSSETATPPRLSFRVTTDTIIAPVNLTPFSTTPVDSAELQLAFADFRLLVVKPPGGSLQSLLVGAIPSKRSYLRFLLPRAILDSASLVRATLLLTQFPNRGFGRADTVSVIAQMVVAGRAITDVQQAARLLADQSQTQIEPLLVAATDSGTREIDIASLLQIWRSVADTLAPRAIVLRSARERVSAVEARFFSSEAAPALRPRLRITYTPLNPYGLP